MGATGVGRRSLGRSGSDGDRNPGRGEGAGAFADAAGAKPSLNEDGIEIVGPALGERAFVIEEGFDDKDDRPSRIRESAGGTGACAVRSLELRCRLPDGKLRQIGGLDAPGGEQAVAQDREPGGEPA